VTNAAPNNSESGWVGRRPISHWVEGGAARPSAELPMTPQPPGEESVFDAARRIPAATTFRP
jgi:hypothetical protein